MEKRDSNDFCALFEFRVKGVPEQSERRRGPVAWFGRPFHENVGRLGHGPKKAKRLERLIARTASLATAGSGISLSIRS